MVQGFDSFLIPFKMKVTQGVVKYQQKISIKLY